MSGVAKTSNQYRRIIAGGAIVRDEFLHMEVAMFKPSIMLADDIEPTPSRTMRLRHRHLDRDAHLSCPARRGGGARSATASGVK